LVVVHEDLVFLHPSLGVLSEVESCLMVAVHLVLVHLWEGTATTHHSRSHAITDLVGGQVGTRIEHHDAVSIVHDVVPENPTEASLDQEDAFTARGTNLVVDYD